VYLIHIGLLLSSTLLCTFFILLQGLLGLGILLWFRLVRCSCSCSSLFFVLFERLPVTLHPHCITPCCTLLDRTSHLAHRTALLSSQLNITSSPQLSSTSSSNISTVTLLLTTPYYITTHFTETTKNAYLGWL
jgi:hypothetical protein